jgi:hypothetical protein
MEIGMIWIQAMKVKPKSLQNMQTVNVSIILNCVNNMNKLTSFRW